MRLQAGLKAWTQVLRGQVEDKADVDMDTEAPQVSHKPGGEPKIKVSICLFLIVIQVTRMVFLHVSHAVKNPVSDEYLATVNPPCVILPQNVIHELRITNQVIYLNPPIEDCRYKLYQEMFSWKTVILSLPRIQSQRYQVWSLL